MKNFNHTIQAIVLLLSTVAIGFSTSSFFKKSTGSAADFLHDVTFISEGLKQILPGDQVQFKIDTKDFYLLDSLQWTNLDNLELVSFDQTSVFQVTGTGRGSLCLSAFDPATGARDTICKDILISGPFQNCNPDNLSNQNCLICSQEKYTFSTSGIHDPESNCVSPGRSDWIAGEFTTNNFRLNLLEMQEGEGIRIAAYDENFKQLIICYEITELGEEELYFPLLSDVRYLLFEGIEGDICTFSIDGLFLKRDPDGISNFEIKNTASRSPNLSDLKVGDTIQLTSNKPGVAYNWSLPAFCEFIGNPDTQSTLVKITDVGQGEICHDRELLCQDLTEICIPITGRFPLPESPCPPDNDVFPGCKLCGNSFSGYTTGFQAENTFTNLCLDEENSQWFSLLPQEESLEVIVNVPTCFHGDGIELLLINDLGQVIDGCRTIDAQNTERFIFNNITPNTPAFLMIDGIDGANCEFEISLPAYNPFANALRDISFQSKGFGFFEASAPPIQNGEEYFWEVDNGFIYEGQGTSRILINSVETTKVCLSVSNSCNLPVKKCKTWEVLLYPGPCGMATDEPPGCLICGPIYLGNTAGFTKEDFSINFPCGTLENTQWLTVVPNSTDMSVTILPSNCSKNKGVEMAIYDINFNLVSSCFSAGNGQTPGNVSASGLVPKDVYFIMVDGVDADVCDFTLTVLSGSTGWPSTPGPIKSNHNPSCPITPGTIVEYQVETDFLRFFDWEVPSNGRILSGNGTTKIEVLWEERGAGAIIATENNACFLGTPVAYPINVLDPITKDFLIATCNNPVPDPVTRIFTSSKGCDSIVNYRYVYTPIPPTSIDSTICPGETVSVGDQTIDTSGFFNIELISERNGEICDSTVSLIVSFGAYASIVEPGPLSCHPDSTLNLHRRVNNLSSTSRHRWFARPGNIVSDANGDSVLIDTPGKYFLEAIQMDSNGMVLCTDLDSVIVGENQPSSPDWVKVDSLACLDQTITFEVMDNYQAYYWSSNKPVDFSSNSNLQEITFLESGINTICVQALDSCGWTVPLCQEVTILPLPTNDFIIPDSICYLDSFQLIYTGNAGPDATYNWEITSGTDQYPFNGPGPFNLAFSDTGSYEITLQVAEDGCSLPPKTKTTQLLPILDTTTIRCAASQDAIFISWDPVPGAEAYDLRIRGNRVGVGLTDPNYLLLNRQPGEVFPISVLPLAAGYCRPAATEKVCKIADCVPARIFLPTIEVCQNEGIVALPDQYGCDWSGPGVIFGACQFDPSNMTPGTYELQQMVANGLCRDTQFLNIRVKESPEINISAEQPTFAGNTGNLLLEVQNSQPNQLVVWNTGSTNQSIFNQNPGDYCGEVFFTNGCTAEKCEILREAAYQLPLLVVLCPGRDKRVNIKPSTGISLNWQPNTGLSCSDCTATTINLQNSALYSIYSQTDVGKRDSTGLLAFVLPEVLCNLLKSDQDEKEVESMILEKTIGKSGKDLQIALEALFPENEEVLLIPNPASDEFSFSASFKVNEIRIYNDAGWLLNQVKPLAKNGKIKISDLSQGIYQVQLIGEKQNISKRLVVVP